MLSNIKSKSYDEKTITFEFNQHESDQNFKCFTTEGEKITHVIDDWSKKNLT